MFAAIAAVDEDLGLGIDGHLQFHISDDLKRFRSLTKGHTVIYGRKTLETFPGAKPLPGRRNIILSRRPGFLVEGAEVVSSMEEAIALCEGEDLTFVIGGATVYKEFLPFTEALYLTRVHVHAPHDVSFPSFGDSFELISESEVYTDEKTGVAYQFLDYKKKGPAV
jgi:dihydrofolate reductase